VLLVLQALAFAGCVLIDLLPSTEVDCRFGVPLATWEAPPPASGNAPATCPAPPPPDAMPTEQCAETAG